MAAGSPYRLAASLGTVLVVVSRAQTERRRY